MVNCLLTISIKVNILSICRIKFWLQGTNNEEDQGEPRVPELAARKRLVRRRESDVVRVPWPADALADVDREEDWERMDTRTP